MLGRTRRADAHAQASRESDPPAALRLADAPRHTHLADGTRSRDWKRKRRKPKHALCPLLQLCKTRIVFKAAGSSLDGTSLHSCARESPNLRPRIRDGA